MNFFWFRLALNKKSVAANFFRLIAGKSGLQTTVQKSLSQRKIMRKLDSDEEKGLLMQYHSINIEKLPKRIKNTFSNIAD